MPAFSGVLWTFALVVRVQTGARNNAGRIFLGLNVRLIKAIFLKFEVILGKIWCSGFEQDVLDRSGGDSTNTEDFDLIDRPWI